MLVIRLSRVGKKKQPTYRIVVQEKQRDPWGTSVEIVGNYNPLTEPKTIVLKEDRIKHWIAQGAQPSDTVHNLLVDAKVISDSKRRATTHDKKEAGESPSAEATGDKEEKTEEKKAETPAEEEKSE
ncbi:MAG: 30S ribosomal protein S16 [Patescibacteria group bacterium]|nr:30S ribosomal protein S16 [Patescibacteria group bacterium]